jgi:hypothetical protein
MWTVRRVSGTPHVRGRREGVTVVKFVAMRERSDRKISTVTSVLVPEPSASEVEA